jgi:hypothetical protein
MMTSQSCKAAPEQQAFAMLNTTKKHASFLSTPLQDCALGEVPGVGPVAHARLVAAGVSTAEQLMGRFLLCGRCEDAMVQWLMGMGGIRAQEAGKIAAALERKGAVTVAV